MRHSTLLTEFTDISQRLEYLVAHSSQLVFVTGEDAAVQQGFVEAFLGQQSNTANVAFLTAKRGKNNQHFRQQLAQQLHLRTSRNQSFVQAFSARDDKSQPVIIAITSAENVPEEVLRELWDLVLQNRFTRNGEQVNILMFGDHEWAEEVKSWLPTNNNDKPVLLTTQTLEYNEETEVEGDLDDLIANRRKLFQQRMQARAQEGNAETSLVTTWWFKLSIAAVFLLSFSSILIWQYFDVTESALKEFSHFLFQTETSNQEENGSGEQTSEFAEQRIEATADINQRVAANFSAAMESIESVNAEATQAAEPVRVNTFTQQSADSSNSEYIADISTEQLKQLRDSGTISPQTVMQTNNAPSASYAEPNGGTQQNVQQQQALQSAILDALNELDSMTISSSEPVQNPAQQADSAPQQADTLPEPVNSSNGLVASLSGAQIIEPEVTSVGLQISQSFEEPVETTSSDPVEQSLVDSDVQDSPVGNVNDFQVEDDGAVESTPVLSPSAQASQAQPGQVLTQQSQLAQPSSIAGEAVYQYHEPILLELPNDSYALQISGITTESLLEEFLVDNRLLNSVWVYKTQRYGGDWFVVLVNQSFDTLEQARNSVSLLTPELQAVEPFAKSVAAIRNEILQ